MPKLRLHKYLADSGIASRRKAEEYIAAGLVRVNSEIAHIGQVIDPEIDTVEMDDMIVEKQKDLVYYMLHKPRGIVTTCAQKWEKTILDIVDIPERIFPVGRLDKDTTGLILLTNDGRLSNFLMHPRYEHEKEYLVTVYGRIEDSELARLSRGVNILDGVRTLPADIRRHNSWSFFITLREGKNRQIRRMVEAVGHTVKRLKRIRIENLVLWNLPEGAYRTLSKWEQEALFARIFWNSARNDETYEIRKNT